MKITYLCRLRITVENEEPIQIPDILIFAQFFAN